MEAVSLEALFRSGRDVEVLFLHALLDEMSVEKGHSERNR